MISPVNLGQLLLAIDRTNFNWEKKDAYNKLLEILDDAFSPEFKAKLELVIPSFFPNDQSDRLKQQFGKRSLSLCSEGYDVAVKHYFNLMYNCPSDMPQPLSIFGDRNRINWAEISREGEKIHLEIYHADQKPSIKKECKLKEPEAIALNRGRQLNFCEIGPDRDCKPEEFKETERSLMELYCHYPLLITEQHTISYFFANNQVANGAAAPVGFVLITVISKQKLSQVEQNLFITLCHVLAYQNALNQIVAHQKIRTAIISILIDSYAHNISAHSLVAIENWFRQRSGMMFESVLEHFNYPGGPGNKSLSAFTDQVDRYYRLLGQVNNPDPHFSVLDLIRLENDISPLQTDRQQFLYDTNPTKTSANPTDEASSKMHRNPAIPVPVDYVIWPFMRFLRGKAAFWSGVTRDLTFGGEHISLYDTFYKEFAENSLYVGTIAATEGIHKLNIRIGLDNNFDEHSDNSIRFYDFVQINSEIIAPDYTEAASRQTAENLSVEQDGIGAPEGKISDKFVLDSSIAHSPHGFLRFGKDFALLRRRLSNEKVFMPGRIVGLHSLMTIIENTVRNVKHYKHNIAEMQKNGLTLLITLEKMDLFNVRKNEQIRHYKNFYKGTHRLYRVGLALGHTISTHKNPYNETIERLFNNILDEKTGVARLGGTYQDKICSSMLLTNKFDNVETVQNRRDFFYYPWTHPIRLSSEDLENCKTFDKIFSNKLREKALQQKDFTSSQKTTFVRKEHKSGDNSYFFKFFNIWKSGNITRHRSGRAANPQKQTTLRTKFKEADNLSRFQLLRVDSMTDYLKELQTRQEERNIYRVIETNHFEIKDNNYYDHWVKKIIPPEKNVIKVYSFDLDPTSINLMYSITDKTITKSGIKRESGFESLEFGELIFVHGENGHDEALAKNLLLNYRSHGIVTEHFAEKSSIKTIFKGVEIKNLVEFTECVGVQIKIWDDRVYQKIPDYADCHEKFERSLRLWINPEIRISQKGPSSLNFTTDEDPDVHTIYVVHLSYIEELYEISEQKNQKKIDWFITNYLEERIRYDIDGEIDLVKTFYSFSLCVVSGRGNDEWYTKEVSDRNLPFVLYKPIESLINAVSDAIEMRDDFQLKYNIYKTLLG